MILNTANVTPVYEDDNKNVATADVTLVYEDEKKSELLLMLLLSMKMIRKCSYC